MKHLLNKKNLITLFLIWFFATCVRSYAVSNYNFPFWFDLGRDAILSREIIEQKDFKIQGPSASGTHDTVFHGVAYYYLIGPLYSLFNGNPQYVLYAVIAFSSLGVIPIYFLTQAITKQKLAATFVGILYVFSYEFFKEATWLSNPVLASVSIPFFFLFYWQIFFENKKHLLPVLFLSLAITHQANILFLPLWGLVGIGFLLEIHSKRIKQWNLKLILTSFSIYLLGVSTILLTQIKLWKAGIFTLESLTALQQTPTLDPKISVANAYGQYYYKILESLYPSFPIISLILFFVLIYFAIKKLSQKTQQFLLILGSSPLLLLFWYTYNEYHTFFTLELLLLIVFASFLHLLTKYQAGKILIPIFLLTYIFSNIATYKLATKQRFGEYFVPQGAYLKELLQTIDYTYEEAHGEDFSISTITNPYGYNTLWAYLYNWYGKEKYGYTPYWYGPDQQGIFGGDLLVRTQSPRPTHFSIREPDQGLPTHIFAWFEQEQTAIATPSATVLYGTIDVRKHTFLD